MVGLDVAGVDVVAMDISRPLEEQGGVIVEVNAAPGLRMHLEPSVGMSRPVGEAIVDTLFPDGDNGRIPIVRRHRRQRQDHHHAASSPTSSSGTGRRVGMTCTDGIYIDDRRIDDGDCSGPQSAANVLMNPAVDAAVLETARGGILRDGLGFDRCDVAVVTNIGEGDHLGLADIDTLEDAGQGETRDRRRGAAQGLRRAQCGRSAGGRRWPPHCPGTVDLLRPRRRPAGAGPRTAAWAAGRSSSATARS